MCVNNCIHIFVNPLGGQSILEVQKDEEEEDTEDSIAEVC